MMRTIARGPLCAPADATTQWQKAANERLGPEVATYELHASAYDAATSTALFFATFAKVIHYVYAVKLGETEDGGMKVQGLTKIFNDAYCAQSMSGTTADE